MRTFVVVILVLNSLAALISIKWLGGDVIPQVTRTRRTVAVGLVIELAVVLTAAWLLMGQEA